MKKAVAVLITMLCIPAFAGQGARSSAKGSSKRTGKAAVSSAAKSKRAKAAAAARAKAAAAATSNTAEDYGGSGMNADEFAELEARAAAQREAASSSSAREAWASADPAAQGIPGSAANPSAGAGIDSVQPTPTNPTPEAATTPMASLTSGPSAEEMAKKPWSVGVDLEQSIGHGTFVRPSELAYFGSTVTVAPSYRFKLKETALTAGASASFGYEFTRPDNDTGRRWSLPFDPRVSLSAPKLFTEKVTGIAFTPGLRATLPLSQESRRASVITQLSASLNLARSFSKFDLSWTVRGTRGFHSNPAIAVTRDDFESQSGDAFRSVLCRSGETLCGSAGINTRYALTNALGVTYNATDKLAFGIDYSLVNSWKYTVAGERDEFTPKVLDSNGNPVADVGAARGADQVSGSLSAEYAFTDRYSASFSMGSVTRARSSDNSAFRFPWFDFAGAAGNSVSYSLTLSASF